MTESEVNLLLRIVLVKIGQMSNIDDPLPIRVGYLIRSTKNKEYFIWFDWDCTNLTPFAKADLRKVKKIIKRSGWKVVDWAVFDQWGNDVQIQLMVKKVAK